MGMLNIMNVLLKTLPRFYLYSHAEELNYEKCAVTNLRNYQNMFYDPV